MQFFPHLPHISCAGYTLMDKNVLHISLTKFNKLNWKRILKTNIKYKPDFWSQKLFLQSLCFIFSFRFLHIFCLSLAERLIFTCSRRGVLTRSQNNVLWIVYAEELKILCFHMITFIFKVVTLSQRKYGLNLTM